MTPHPHPSEPERQAPGEGGDPFSEAADASRETCEPRPRTWGVPEPPEIRGPEWAAKKTKPKAKRVDLNPHERKWLTANGYVWARVETANAWGSVTVDLWNAFDFIAAHPEQRGTLYVQVTDRTNLAARLKKVQSAPETAVLLAAGNQVEIHVWRQRGGRGSRWELERRPVTAETTSR